MGRREQREREKRKAAAICHTIEQFLPAKKSCTEALTSQVIAAEQQPCSSTTIPLAETATTLDAVQQTSFNPALLHCAGGNKEHIDVTDCNSIEVTESPVEANPDRLVRSDCSSSKAIDLANDFGTIYSCSKAPNDFIAAIQGLSSTERYSLLKCHVVPPNDYIFPLSSFGKSKRKFQPKWLTKNTWMVYSAGVDGVFCKYCALFSDSRHTKEQFVNEPFRAWNKISEKTDEHEKCSYHQASLKAAEEFIERIEFPETRVSNHLDKVRTENIARNRGILKCIIEAILFCAKQCIALRGDFEK